MRVPVNPAISVDCRVERDHLLPGLKPTYAPPDPPDAPPPALRSAAFGPSASSALTLTLPGDMDKKTPVYELRNLWETLMRFSPILEERGLAAVWWYLAEASKTSLCLVLQAASPASTSSQSHPYPTTSFYVPNNWTWPGTPRRRSPPGFISSSLPFSPRLRPRRLAHPPVYGTSSFTGGGTPSMCKTTQFFRDQGVPPIEDWQSAKTTTECMVILLPTLLSNKHSICGQLLGLIHFLQSRHLSLSRRARREPLLPSQFIERIHQDMDIYLQYVLALAKKAFILPNIGDLRYALDSPGPLIALAMAPTKPPTCALVSHMGNDGGAPSRGDGNGGSGGEGGSGSGSGGGGGGIRSRGGRGGPLRGGGTSRAKQNMYLDQTILLPPNCSLW